jgi:hypothetical protein
MDKRKWFLVPLGLRPDILCDKDVIESGPEEIKNHKRSCKKQEELNIFFLDYKFWDQIIDRKVGDQDIQRKLNEIGFN